MKISVVLFAAAKDIVGQPKIEIEVCDKGTVNDAKQSLAKIYPNLAPLLDNSAMAIGNEYCRMDQTLRDGDELACIPPVSGG